MIPLWGYEGHQAPASRQSTRHQARSTHLNRLPPLPAPHKPACPTLAGPVVSFGQSDIEAPQTLFTDRLMEAATGSGSKNPFVCNLCKKTYTRLDHLGRHYRTRDSLNLSSAPHLLIACRYQRETLSLRPMRQEVLQSVSLSSRIHLVLLTSPAICSAGIASIMLPPANPNHPPA